MRDMDDMWHRNIYFFCGAKVFLYGWIYYSPHTPSIIGTSLVCTNRLANKQFATIL